MGCAGMIGGSPWDCLWIAQDCPRLRLNYPWFCFGIGGPISDRVQAPRPYLRSGSGTRMLPSSDRAQAPECYLFRSGTRMLPISDRVHPRKSSLFPIGLRHQNAPNSEVSSRRCAQSHHHARPSRVAKRRHSHWENTSFTHHYQTVKNAVSSPREHQSHGELATRLSIALRTAN